MNIYRYEKQVTAASGSVSSTTLNIRGGLLRQFLVRAGTSDTLFRCALSESGGIAVLNYGYHNGEVQDVGATGALPLPVLGIYTLSITNASRDDTFNVRLLVQE